MAEKYGVSETEYNIAKIQAARRAEMRREYLKQRTNPWKHASESGHVFDEAHQRYISMQATQLERFRPNRSNAIFGICAIVIPMVTYGWLCVSDRAAQEEKIRNGELRYRDRLFKLI